MTEVKIEDQKVFTIEEYQSNGDLLYAAAYAWGRSDGGANLDANDIYQFSKDWQEKKRAFRQGEASYHTSLMGFYDEFFADKKKN